MNPSAQPEFSFDQPDASSSTDGLGQWRQQRERASHRLARRLGLPLDHDVEIWLKNGMMLRGKLQLKESMLFLESVEESALELAVNRAIFRYAEMESCVRMD